MSQKNPRQKRADEIKYGRESEKEDVKVGSELANLQFTSRIRI